MKYEFDDWIESCELKKEIQQKGHPETVMHEVTVQFFLSNIYKKSVDEQDDDNYLHQLKQFMIDLWLKNIIEIKHFEKIDNEEEEREEKSPDLPENDFDYVR